MLFLVLVDKKFYPFVALEGVWALVALLSLFNVPRGTSVPNE
jgi:hypothetical protein